MWSVWHDAQIDPRHLEEEGAPPAAYEDIKRRLMARQDEEDPDMTSVDLISEIPLELAESVTGYRHDRFGPEYFELVPGDATAPRKTGFFGNLKGLFR